jgi:uncharacterized protein (TIGR03435 family)
MTRSGAGALGRHPDVAVRKHGIPPIDPNGPALGTALLEQLGLKLQSATSRMDVVVIDSVERPTPDWRSRV